MKTFWISFVVLCAFVFAVAAWLQYGTFESRFNGKLEVVNTGCFYDTECFVVVDGKHVTAIVGWSQEIVGSVQGLQEGEGFGDLDKYIGREVEVFAKEIEYGNYTLYGNADYYIKVE